jgi:chemotaxis signal transduction protein
MTYILFEINGDSYAFPAKRIERIIPFVNARALPHAPEFVLGLLNYRKTSVPLLDLGALLGGGPTKSALSTRIMLTRYLDPDSSSSKGLLGLLAPSIVETIHIDESTLKPKGITIEQAPYLGPVAATDKGLIQVLELESILTETLKKSLFEDLSSKVA